MVITDEVLEKKKRNAKEILRYFINFCDSHGLQYYCAFGTAIGAVRHKGFIPWDDDIDVQMPRPDYERLMQLKDRIDNAAYELVEARFSPGCYTTFAKLSDKNTTLIEYEGMPGVFGNYIDIFPIDGISNRQKEFRRDYRFSQSLRKKLFAVSVRHGRKWILRQLSSFHPVTVFKYLWCSIGRAHRRVRVLEGMRKLSEKHPFDESVKVASYGLWYGHDRHDMPKEWFGKGVKGSFEDLEVLLPCEYDKMLRKIYGDYMQLPPERERQTQHRCVYINLDERVNYPNDTLK